MARIVMTWELGAGYGHMGPLMALARPLQAAGHELAFAVRTPPVAESLLQGTGMTVYQAPANLQVSGGLVLHSFPQILLNTCFNRRDEIVTRVRAWQELFVRARPDLLLCDHSPTALLAARAAGIKAIAIGYGFVMPPDISPLPNLRPWDNASNATLAQDEARLLEMLNGALQDLGAQPLDYVAQLYGGSQTLFSFQELDNYAPYRRGADYLGPLYLAGGRAPQWPALPGKRIFAYVRPFKTQPALLEALRQSGQPTLIHAPDIAPDLLQRYAGGNLLFSAEPLDVDAVAAQCDLAILHGGHGTLARMLLAGKPLLLLPLHLEMLINASSVLKLGAGLAAPQLQPEGMKLKLARLLDEPAFTAAAGRFAERYAAADVENLPSRFLPQIDRLLAA